jgi:hypothetical protein
MANLTNITHSTANSLRSFNYSEVLNLKEIQPLQDLQTSIMCLSSLIAKELINMSAPIYRKRLAGV